MRLILTTLLALLTTACDNAGTQYSIAAVDASLETPKAFVKTDASSDTVAFIDKVPNYTTEEVTFQVAERQKMRLQSVGEILVGNKLEVWDCDHIELCFDVDNSKTVGFQSDAGDRRLILGSKDDVKEVEYFFDSTLADAYVIEVGIPWDYLRVQPAAGLVMGFDYVVVDNDGTNREEGSLSLFSNDIDYWINTSLYGEIELSRGKDANTEKGTNRIAAAFSKISPKIDGITDAVWSLSQNHAAKKISFGSVDGAHDLQADMRTLWNASGLYFTIIVHDDKKVFNFFDRNICDYASLKRENGDVLWEMGLENSAHAGGAPKNRMVDTLITLDKGNYALRYVSDESHSYNKWDAPPPNAPFYGVLLRRQQ